MAREVLPIPVIEWSPSRVRVWLPSTGKILEAASISALKGELNGSGQVVIALSRRSSFVRTVRLPDAPKHEVARILSLQIGTLFPVSPTEVSVDFALTGDKNSEGRLCVVGAVKSSTLLSLMDELSALGLKTRAIVPAALGSGLLAQALGKEECAVVEVVPEGLAIDIVAEGELRSSRVVPMPDGSQIDSEVARSFGVAKLPKTDSIAAGGLVFPEATSLVETSSLASMGSTELPFSLEPRDIVEKREKQRSGRTQRVALMLWIATFLLAAVIWDQRTNEALPYQKGDARWRKRLANLKTTKNQAEAKLTSIQKVNTALDLGFEPSQRLSDVIRVVSSLAPQGLWLTGISAERGKPLLLRGTAMTNDAVTKYLEALSSQSRFRDAHLVFANNGQIEKTNVVQFSISAHVVGNLPLDTEVLKP